MIMVTTYAQMVNNGAGTWSWGDACMGIGLVGICVGVVAYLIFITK